MTIYIDIVLVENIIMNYIILFATAIVLKIKIKHIRFLLLVYWVLYTLLFHIWEY